MIFFLKQRSLGGLGKNENHSIQLTKEIQFIQQIMKPDACRGEK